MNNGLVRIYLIPCLNSCFIYHCATIKLSCVACQTSTKVNYSNIIEIEESIEAATYVEYCLLPMMFQTT